MLCIQMDSLFASQQYSSQQHWHAQSLRCSSHLCLSCCRAPAACHVLLHLLVFLQTRSQERGAPLKKPGAYDTDAYYAEMDQGFGDVGVDQVGGCPRTMYHMACDTGPVLQAAALSCLSCAGQLLKGHL